MSEKSAMFLVLTGLLMAFGGVGGVENSVDNLELLQSTLVSIAGLGLLLCGTLAIKTR